MCSCCYIQTEKGVTTPLAPTERCHILGCRCSTTGCGCTRISLTTCSTLIRAEHRWPTLENLFSALAKIHVSAHSISLALIPLEPIGVPTAVHHLLASSVDGTLAFSMSVRMQCCLDISILLTSHGPTASSRVTFLLRMLPHE